MVFKKGTGVIMKIEIKMESEDRDELLKHLNIILEVIETDAFPVKWSVNSKEINYTFFLDQ